MTLKKLKTETYYMSQQSHAWAHTQGKRKFQNIHTP